MARPAGASVVAGMLALGLASPVAAGDRALAGFIGFSADARYFAFEEYGIQDGSGFPYSTIFVVDLTTDSWVQGSPYRATTEDETASLAAARTAALEMAKAKLQSLAITEPAYPIALVGDGEPGDGMTLDFGQPGYRPGALLAARKLTLEVYDASDDPNCIDFMGEPGKGFALTLSGSDIETREVHRDAAPLPKSRGCVTAYRLYAVVTPADSDPETGVAIVSTYPVGFEGPNRRFLAVPLRP